MRHFQAREARFSPKVLRAYAAVGLPAALGVRAVDGAPIEILLYDEIGYWGVTAKDFVLALAQAGAGPIHLRINSPGGDVFEGLAIYNALKARAAPVTVTIDGVAASAASYVAMAGGVINMPAQAMLMIHNCWGICFGNRNDMLEMAAVQAKIDGMMAEIYARKSGQTKEAMTAAMDAETWYTSSEAKAVGLCDIVAADAPQNAALIGAKFLARTGLRARVEGVRSQLPPYDPDGDGDNDAEEALGLINSALLLLDAAADSLAGEPEEDGAAEPGENETAPIVPILPGARARRKPRAAATEPEQAADAAEAAEDLPIAALSDDDVAKSALAARQRRLRLADAETV